MLKKKEWCCNDEYQPSYEKTEQQIETARELIELVKNYIENKKID